MKTRVKGSILAIIGYLLSPLSFWNDFFVNLPIAYLFALLLNTIWPGFFLGFMIIGYWLTNILGFLLMHYGVINTITGKKRVFTKKEIVKDVTISLVYTFLVVLLAKAGYLKLPLH